MATDERKRNRALMLANVGEVSEALRLILDVTDGIEQRISALTLRVEALEKVEPLRGSR